MKGSMFRAGIYCRVSVADADKEGEYSSSIYAQINMAEAYISEHQDVTSGGLYIDDGVSGSNFNRPQFRRMIADIELGNINMIIFKDVSRLGREHTDTNYFLEKYTVERGVRVVSLLDHYDSQANPYDEMLWLKTLMHERYLRDTSGKIRSVIQMKRSRGEYTAKEAPYGYVKSKTQHNHLDPDPFAAEVVRRIYRMYLHGHGCTVICRTLNEDKILCPSRYKKEILKTECARSACRGLWTDSTVRHILQNPVYTGAVVLKKTERPSYKIKYRKTIPLSEQELCENAHEAIISKKQFEQAQNHRIFASEQAVSVHRYFGLLFCGACGYRMRKRYHTSHGVYDGYICGTHQEFGQSYCTRNPISFETLDQLVAFALNRQFLEITAELDGLKKQIAVSEYASARPIQNLNRKMEKNRKAAQKAYEQYMDELLTQEDYRKRKEQYDTENSRHQAEWEKLTLQERKEQTILARTEQWLDTIARGNVTGQHLNRTFLEELIGRIDLYPDRQADLYVRFRRAG